MSSTGPTSRVRTDRSKRFQNSADTPPAEGLLCADFYVSADGTRAFTYALWTSAEAHRRAIENRPEQLETNAQWQQAHAWPGLISTVFQRFRPRLQLAPLTIGSRSGDTC